MARTTRRNEVLEGADDLDKALKKLGDRTTGLLLKQAAEKAAQIVADEAKELAPKDTGDLAESIQAEVHKVQNGRAQFNIGFGRKEFYGTFHELGNEKLPASPFLRPALEAKQEEAAEAVEELLRDALREVL
jgi:HK97 gp10 family phage protein